MTETCHLRIPGEKWHSASVCQIRGIYFLPNRLVHQRQKQLPIIMLKKRARNRASFQSQTKIKPLAGIRREGWENLQLSGADLVINLMFLRIVSCIRALSKPPPVGIGIVSLNVCWSEEAWLAEGCRRINLWKEIVSFRLPYSVSLFAITQQVGHADVRRDSISSGAMQGSSSLQLYGFVGCQVMMIGIKTALW